MTGADRDLKGVAAVAVVGSPLLWLALWLGVISAVLVAGGPQRVLAPICATAMYGAGWPCFATWFAAALVAMPLRVAGSGRVRQAFHGGLWCLVWLWWVLAVGPADLYARADLLWWAYLAVGGAVASWRLVLHGGVLRALIRRSLRAHPMSPGVLALGQDEFPQVALPERSVAGRILLLIARVHAWRVRRSLHAFFFGPTGSSGVLLQEAMRATNQRAAAVRSALVVRAKTASSQGAVRTAAKRGLDALRPEATSSGSLAADLASAHQCETRIALALRRRAETDDVGEQTVARSLAVMESIVLSALRSESPDACARFGGTLALAASAGVVSPGVPTVLLRLFSALRCDIEEALLAAEQSVVKPGGERAIVELGACLMLCRHRLYRPAKGLLGATAGRYAKAADSAADGSIERIAHSITSEIELQSATVNLELAGSVDEERNRKVVERRLGASDFHGRSGRHPRFGGRAVLPSGFALFSPPHRPREVGVGLCAAAFAGLLLFLRISVLPPDPPGRLHEVRDVPFGGSIASTNVRSAAVAGVAGDRDVLLTDPMNGIRRFELSTLSVEGEGGPGTALDGAVRQLAANADGTVLAVFTSRADGSTCVSARGLDGLWRPVIAPAELNVGGDELAGAIDGLPLPLLFRSKGAPRLLVYDSSTRSLRPAELADGAAPILGDFVTATADRTNTSASCAFVLTSGPGGGVYRLSAIGPGSPLRVEALGLPIALLEADAVAVGPGGDGEALLVDRKGCAWRSDASRPDGAWVQLRAGAQDLRLDRVDVAAITENGGRMWFVREGVAWTRALPATGEPPSEARGWATCQLPIAAPIVADERLLLVELAGRAEVVVLRTAGAGATPRGYAVRLALASGSVTLDDLLQGDERLIDADSWGRSAAMRTVAMGADGLRVHRIDALDLGRRTGEKVGDLRQPIRSWIEPSPADAASFDGSVLAFGANSQVAIALFRDGRFLRFDPLRDLLLPAAPGLPGTVGEIPLRPDVIDAVVDASTEPATAWSLGPGGRIESFTLTTAKSPSPSTRVDAGDVVPAGLVTEATHAITANESAVVSAPGLLWRLDLSDAARLWTDLSSSLAGSKRPAELSFAGAAEPLLAWPASAAQPARMFRQGAMRTVEELEVSILEPGIRQPYFGRAEVGGTIHALDADGRSRVVLPQQERGPADVQEATIRPDYIDYLAHGRLHSVSIDSGVWTDSGPIEGDCKLAVVETPSGEAVVVVPRGRQGVSYAAKPGSGADTLRSMGRGVKLRSISPLGGGVVGIDANHDIRWFDALGKANATLKHLGAPGIDLDVVEEAIGRSGILYLRGRSRGRSAVVGYPMSHESAFIHPAEDIAAIELGREALFALQGGRVVALDPQTLAQQHVWNCDGRDVALGRSDHDSADPPLAVDGSISLLARPALEVVLQGAVSAPGAAPKVAAAHGSTITLFTPDGAWSREASPLAPFRRVPGVRSLPQLVRFGPDGGAPWIRMDGRWTRLGETSSFGSDLGWTPKGQIVGVNRLTESPEFDGVTPAAFAPVPDPLGVPRAVERINFTTALVVGDDGAVLFDSATHQFADGGSALRDVNSRARIVHRGQDCVRILREDKRVVEVRADGARLMFGGARVEDYLDAPTTLAGTVDGLVIDALAGPIRDLPPVQPGGDVLVAAVTPVDGGFLRVVDRQVERFDVQSMQLTTVKGLEADELARCGLEVFAFDRVAHRVVTLSGEATADVLGWYPAQGCVALLSPSGGVSVLSERGVAQVRAAAEPLPGQFVGNLPGSAVAVLQVGDETYALYDLLAGTTVGKPMRGRGLAIAPGAAYLVNHDGRRILRCNARGEIRESGVFEQVVVRADSTGADIYAAMRSSDDYRVLRLDAESLEPIRVPVFEARARFPSEKPGQARAVTVTLGQATLLVTSDRLGLYDGQAVTIGPNPLGTAAVKAMLYAGCIQITTNEGASIHAVRLVRGRPELAPEPTVFQYRDLGLDRTVLPVPLPTRTFTDSVPFAGSSVDLASGWIVAEWPKALSVGDGLVVEFDSGAAPRHLAPLRVANQSDVLAPLALRGGELVYEGQHGEARLGVPAEGRRLPIHEPKAVAPLTENTCVWIDAMGQLWASGPDGNAHLSISQAMEGFRVDAKGAVYALAGARRFGFTVGSRGTVTVAEAAGNVRLHRDATHLLERAGPFRWSSPGAEGAASFQWEIDDGAGGWIALRATKNGFDLLARSKLVLLGHMPAIQTGSAATPLFAPIRGNAVDWSQLTGLAVAGRLPSAEPLGTNASLEGGLSIKLTGEVLTLHFVGLTFPYQLGNRRFASAVCSAATVGGGRLIVAAEGGSCLLSWGLGEAGELVAPSRIELPPRRKVRSLLPGDVADEFVAEFVDVDTNESTLSSWRAGSWSVYEQPKFVRTPDARWSWNLGSSLAFSGNAPLPLVPDRQPLLACDRVELDPLNSKQPGEAVRALGDGSILYRGIGGQWFRFKPQEMPQPCDPPASTPSRLGFDGFQIERWPGSGRSAPSCELVFGDMRLPIDLRVRDGLIEDLDGWSDDPIEPTEAAAFEVASLSGKTRRTIEVVNGMFRVSPRRPAAHPKPYDRFRLRLQRGAFTLVDGRALRRGAFDFGLPAKGGFAALDASLVVPLGNAADGSLVCAGEGHTVAFDPSRPLATIREVERGVSIERAAWEVLGGKPVFVGRAAGGGRLRVDADTFTTQELPALPAGHLHCVRLENGVSLDAERSESRMVFDRAGADPLRLVLRIEGAAASFEHLRADRIETDVNGLVTHSAAWTARYAKNGDRFRLASVTVVDEAARARDRWDLPSGLVIRRSPATGDCSLRIDERDEAPTWPLSALLGPGRIFVDENRSTIEAAAHWARRIGSNGLVAARWPGGRGAAIASAGAFRNAEDIVAGRSHYVLSLDGPLAVDRIGASVPKPGQQVAGDILGWRISLSRYGGDCVVDYQGISLEVRDGALPMDMAVVPGGATHALLVDRLGIQRVGSGAQGWSMHPEAHRGSMVHALPSALVGVSAGPTVRSCFSVASPGQARLFALPSSPDGAIEVVPAGDTVVSWALGRQVAFRFGRDGVLHVSRVGAAPNVWHDFRPLPKAELCVNGRLAFDMPEDLILARRPDSAVAEGCVVMRGYWEWPDPDNPGGFRALTATAPEPAEPEFGSVVRSEWFKGSDISSSSSTNVVGVTGPPIIWCTFGDRLFLVGERSIAWLELGQRWRGLTPE